MSEQLMIKCDNPECKSIGEPEWVPGQDGQRKRRGQRATPPYGWHDGSGWVVGCGPHYLYVACSNACVGPAIVAMTDKARQEENG